MLRLCKAMVPEFDMDAFTPIIAEDWKKDANVSAGRC